MTDQNDDMRSTAREWRIALIVVLGGFVIAIAIAAYFALRPVPQAPSAATQSAPALTTEQRKQLAIKIGKILCDAEMLNAKSIGIVPPYGKSASLPMRTDQKGRFACLISTGVAKYLIAADVKCNELLDPRCVEVYSVTSDDGTVLYKRPDKKPATK